MRSKSFAQKIGLTLLLALTMAIFAMAAAAEGVVTGVLKDQDGQLVGGLVSLGDSQVMTDAYGRFDFGAVAAGNYDLQVFIGGESVHKQAVAVSGKTDLNVAVSLGKGTNLLPNPTWEGAPELPAGWLIFHRSELGKTIFFEKSGNAWVFSVEDPDTGVYGLQSELLPVQPGKSYRATGMVNVDRGGGQATLYLEFFDADGKRVGRQNAHSTSKSWTELVLEEVAPKDAVSMYVRLISQGAVVGKNYFKDLKLTRR